MGLLAKKGGWQEVAPVDSFTVSREVHIGQHRYTLFKLNDGIYCTQGSCSHEHSPLCEGIVMDGEVFCAKHGSRFDIKTGRVINPPATEPLKIYDVKVEDGRVIIKT